MAELEISYNGVRIDGEIDVSAFVYEAHAWGSLDWAEASFPDPEGRWARWAPRAGDTVSARLGAARTGPMHVTRARRRGGTVDIRAISAPPEMTAPRWRSWDTVRLHQLCEQIAEECGLRCELYGVDDRLYGQVIQGGTGDARFLARRLAMEGASLIVFDGRLAVVSGEWIQRQAPIGSIALGSGPGVELADRSGSAWGGCRVAAGPFAGEFRAGPGPLLHRALECPVSGDAEAARFARGLLRSANRDAAAVLVRRAEGLGWLCAGGVAALSVDGDPSWSGPHVVEKVRHDFVAEVSSAAFARFLEGY